MAIEQWGFFSMPHLLRHGASVYNSHLWGPVTNVIDHLEILYSEKAECFHGSVNQFMIGLCRNITELQRVMSYSLMSRENGASVRSLILIKLSTSKLAFASETVECFKAESSLFMSLLTILLKSRAQWYASLHSNIKKYLWSQEAGKAQGETYLFQMHLFVFMFFPFTNCTTCLGAFILLRTHV